MKTLRKVSGIIVLFMVFSCFFQPLNFAFAQTAQSSAQSQKPTTLVNINNAGAEELQAVRGIGPVLAERVVSYRQSNGQFKKLEDLRQVKGIGTAKFEKIKDQITL